MPNESLRPTVAGVATSDLPSFYLGLNRLSLGEPHDVASGAGGGDDGAGDVRPALTAADGPFGFDLDGRCTRVEGCTFAESCVQSNAAPMPDGPYCSDNAYARLHTEAVDENSATAHLALSNDAINCSLREGRYNQLLRLTGYNGMPDDDQVRVDFYASTGLEGGGASDPSAPCAASQPAWQAGAMFRVLENDLAAPMSSDGGLPNSKIVANNAFVRDGYLVAFLPQGYEIKLFGDSDQAPAVQFNLRQAVVAGRLAKRPEGSFYIEHGAIAGRQAAQDVLRSFGQVGVCEQGDHAELHAAIRTYMENYSDIALEADARQDSACDGVSTAFSFTADSVVPGSIAPERQVLNCCLPGNAGRGGCPLMRCGDGQVTDGEACDIAVAAGAPGACPTACQTADSCQSLTLRGEGCDARCVASAITEPADGDGCCSMGASSISDDDCEAVCGNGVVEDALGETCDPPDSCPTADTCETGSSLCTVTSFKGSADSCDARCETEPITGCNNGDGCCAPGCTWNTDNDCSATCGNGQVDPRETCDGNCPTMCATAGADACNAMELVGTVAQCSAQCVQRAVKQCKSGDGCCPANCNGGNDGDCQSRCGNRITEPQEECDDGNEMAGDGCDRCERETNQRSCRTGTAGVDTVSEACLSCMCSECADDVVSCFDTGTADDQSACRDLALCRLRTWCYGLNCYTPDGPCMSEVAEAGMSTSVVTLIARSDDFDHRFGRASLVEICSQEHCTAACAR